MKGCLAAIGLLVLLVSGLAFLSRFYQANPDDINMRVMRFKEITEPDLLQAFGKAVRMNGYACSRVTRANNRGQVSRGIEIQIFCEPERGEDYSQLAYRGILMDDGQIVVTRWQ
jgi:hypothetical protein